MSKRNYESGYSKRQHAKEKELKKDEMLAKVPKLTTFFTKRAKEVQNFSL